MVDEDFDVVGANFDVVDEDFGMVDKDFDMVDTRFKPCQYPFSLLLSLLHPFGFPHFFV